jgi:hypothetical protein
MAIIIEATYAKKLGLPNYSSHQYSVTIRTEIPDIAALEKQNKELYSLLQSAVDAEITQPGFVPESSYGINEQTPVPATNGHHTNGDSWKCSDKQRELIQKIVTDNRLDKREVDELSQQRFGVGVRNLNKMQASGLIEELLQTHGKSNGNGQTNGHRYQRK